MNQLIDSSKNQRYSNKLILDCSNGVGYTSFLPVQEQLKEHLDVTIINSDDLNKLNEGCGAEFVDKHVTTPANYKDGEWDGVKCYSFDGDADRLMMYYKDKDTK
jgi:phosphoacetylglucosamine mutase